MKKIIPLVVLFFFLVQLGQGQTQDICVSAGAFHNEGSVAFFGQEVENNGELSSGAAGALIFIPATNQLLKGTKSFISSIVDFDGAQDKSIITIQNVKGVTATTRVNFTRGIVATAKTVPANDTDLPSLIFDGLTSDYNNTATDAKHVNGYVTKKGLKSFKFPVGDGSTVSYLEILPTAEEAAKQLSVAYYDAENSKFPRANKASGITDVNPTFWHVITTNTTPMPTRLYFKNLAVTGALTALKVVGYSKSTQKWEDLGNAGTSGTSADGYITSNSVNLSLFDALTVAGAGLVDKVLISGKALLGGPFNSSSKVMVATIPRDKIPTTDPYKALLDAKVIKFGTPVNPIDETLSNKTDIVDWVFVELRQPGTAVVKATRSLLLKTDGTMVTPTGATAIEFNTVPATYDVVIRHRNHLGATIESKVLSATSTVVDFTTTATPANQQMNLSSLNMLWPGDGTGDGKAIFRGAAATDLFTVFSAVKAESNLLTGSVAPATYAALQGDYNLDGNISYPTDVASLTATVSTFPLNIAKNNWYIVSELIKK